jgi:hypothetical protein
MIKGVIIHMMGDLPLVADMAAMPTATDVSLLCTNVRTVDGKRPTFIEHHDWVMVIPLATVRLVELPRHVLTAEHLAEGNVPAAATNGNGHSPHGFEPVPEPPAPAPTAPPPAIELPAELPDLEPNEDLLRRIREA